MVFNGFKAVETIELGTRIAEFELHEVHPVGGTRGDNLVAEVGLACPPRAQLARVPRSPSDDNGAGSNLRYLQLDPPRRSGRGD